jgi:hypothetical protein
MSVWERSGEQPATLANAPALPDACGQLWAYFIHMHQRRGYTQSGPERITDIGIDAWQRLNGVKLSAWQLDAITQADDAFLAEYAKGVKRGS